MHCLGEAQISHRGEGKSPFWLKRHSWSGKILHDQFMITLIHQSKWHASSLTNSTKMWIFQATHLRSQVFVETIKRTPFWFLLKSWSYVRSGTSQSCGLAAGAAGLVREYLSEWADLTSARLGQVWASSIKATLVAAADLDRSGGSSGAKIGWWMGEKNHGDIPMGNSMTFGRK